jgi:hypothetical protein
MRVLKKKMYEIKETTQDMKEGLNKDMENLRKKESNRNPGNKKSFCSNKKYRGSRLEQV